MVRSVSSGAVGVRQGQDAENERKSCAITFVLKTRENPQCWDFLAATEDAAHCTRVFLASDAFQEFERGESAWWTLTGPDEAWTLAVGFDGRGEGLAPVMVAGTAIYEGGELAVRQQICTLRTEDDDKRPSIELPDVLLALGFSDLFVPAELPDGWTLFADDADSNGGAN